MRLDKFLSSANMTRTQARNAVKSGRVLVNGVMAKDPAGHINPEDAVTVNGSQVFDRGHSHIMLNKPAGVVTAQSDGKFKTVFDVLGRDMLARGLCAVGRLDRDTTGLLLFTTDGELAHRLISPGRNVDKVYLARVDAKLDGECVRAMAEGVRLKDFTAKPAEMTIIDDYTALITVTEGKYHQVKRMFGSLGRNVVALKRLSVAGVRLDGDLGEGEARRLMPDEISALYRAVDLEEKADE